MAVGKLLSLPVPQFPLCKVEIRVPTLGLLWGLNGLRLQGCMTALRLDRAPCQQRRLPRYPTPGMPSSLPSLGSKFFSPTQSMAGAPFLASRPVPYSPEQLETLCMHRSLDPWPEGPRILLFLDGCVQSPPTPRQVR